jgi:UDP-glucose 4-epimerase
MLAAASGACDGRTLNVGGDRVISLRDTADALVAASNTPGGYEIRVFPEERKRIDIGDYYADDSTFRGLTGWAPAVPLEEGLARTVAFYRENLARYV